MRAFQASVSLRLLAFVPLLALLDKGSGVVVRGNGSRQDQALDYPVIVNYEEDKAIFITPHKGCRVLSQRDVAYSMDLRRIGNIYQEDRETVNDIIALCEQYQNESISAAQFLGGVRDAAILIYPGTKWCGVGNRATNATDLGSNERTDKCCRDHDSCTDYVERFSCHKTIDGLCNRSPFTRSNCNCDERFRDCLRETNEDASRSIGILFFTVFGLRCFRQDYPILGCTEYGGFLNIHCQKYELNYTGEPYYQFFDSPKYAVNRTGTGDGDGGDGDDVNNSVLVVNVSTHEPTTTDIIPIY